MLVRLMKVKTHTKKVWKTNSDDYYEKYKKIKLNWDDDLPLKETLQLCNMIIIVRVVFQENRKYYLQVFLNKWNLMLTKLMFCVSALFVIPGTFLK